MREGSLMNVLSSRETAADFDQRSNGTMRAAGWTGIPLLRMTNINHAPGQLAR